MKSKTLTFFALLVLGGQSVLAQNWCPPGATWNYDLMSFMIEGCETRTYAGDTILDGRNAQRILVNTVLMNYMSGSLDTTNTVLYTAQEDGLVLAWGTGSGESWDTLYWCSAEPGDRWYPPGADGQCAGQHPLGMLQVVDTGHVVINDQRLRFLDMAYVGEFGQQVDPFTITERLGAPWMVIPPGGCIVSEAGSTIRTYMDDDMSYDSGAPSTCEDLIDQVGQVQAGPAFAVYPNPAGEWVRFPSDAVHVAHVSVLDVHGRIMHTSAVNGNGRLDIRVLAPGYYMLKLFGPRGTLLGYAPMMKE